MGDHRKPLPLLPRLRRLDRGIDCKQVDCSAKSLTDAMISPIIWLCSLRLTMLSAIDPIWSLMRFIRSMDSSTDFFPLCEAWAVFLAISETYWAF